MRMSSAYLMSRPPRSLPPSGCRGLTLLVGLLTTVTGFAQETGLAQMDIMEEVVTTGTRAKARVVADAPAPIDVITGDDFVNQGDSDLGNLLRNVVPSLNINTQPISDAGTIVRPPNLRGLAPDHTLVLVNGKRRHRASIITWIGNGIANGAQGPDLASIPAIALKRVEVLRDGAAAQYGSDAIAGVLNFILKDHNDGSTFEARYGQTTENDGDMFRIAGNVGLPFTASGFANLSFEYGETDPTVRSIQRNDAQALIDESNDLTTGMSALDGYLGERGAAVPVPAMIWGSPIINEDLKLWGNMGVEINSYNSFYAHANYLSKEVDGGFYYRHPNTRGGVFGTGGGTQLLIGDLTPDRSANCPAVGVGDDGLVLAEDRAAWNAVLENDNCFTMQKMLPGGFTPRFGGNLTDVSLVAGVEGEADSKIGTFNWDFSASYGENEVDFFIYNTVNASLGPDTPLSFDPGAYIQTEVNFNVDLGYEPTDYISIAIGYEWREEEFEIRIGEQASWEDGPLADQGFTPASNGFSGFGPRTAGVFSRYNHAFYFDAEWELTDAILVTGAVRHEEFEDFGGTTNWKVGGNWRVFEQLGFRATASTGFKAPTPGQSNAFNISTVFNQSLGDLVNEGVIPSTHPLAEEYGGQALDPEESLNLTFGTFFNVGELDVTVDYYNIKVEDRLNLSTQRKVCAGQRPAVVDPSCTAYFSDLEGDLLAEARTLQSFKFFINDFDTRTQGVDIVATYPLYWDSGNTDISLAFNHTETKVIKRNPETVGDGRVKEIEEGVPQTRWNLAANHNMDAWRFLGRVSFYDGWYDSEDGNSYDGEFVFDLEAAYSVNDRATLTAGVQNVFDNQGNKNPKARDQTGNLYSQWAPFGFDGTFYYFRASYAFDY